MTDSIRPASHAQLIAILQSFALGQGLRFGEILDVDSVLKAIKEEVVDIDEPLFTPLATSIDRPI